MGKAGNGGREIVGGEEGLGRVSDEEGERPNMEGQRTRTKKEKEQITEEEGKADSGERGVRAGE